MKKSPERKNAQMTESNWRMLLEEREALNRRVAEQKDEMENLMAEGRGLYAQKQAHE
jgi:hypothetical protein